MMQMNYCLMLSFHFSFVLKTFSKLHHTTSKTCQLSQYRSFVGPEFKLSDLNMDQNISRVSQADTNSVEEDAKIYYNPSLEGKTNNVFTTDNTADEESQTDEKTNDSHPAPNKIVSLVIRKLLSASYDTWYLHFILLFSAFVCDYGYGLDGNSCYFFPGYATAAYAENSLLSTINVINAVISAVSQNVYARSSDVYG